MLWISALFGGLIILGSAISYRHFSSKTAETFLSRAEQEAAAGRFDQQVIWLDRYSLLRPNDTEAIINTALAANAAADAAEFDVQGNAVNIARKHLSNAIGRLGVEQSEEKAQLRKLLVERLLQSGGFWNREAEKQIALLAADPDDPESTKWMALALAGQVTQDLYLDRTPIARDENPHWLWLSKEPPGEVLITAIVLNPSDVKLIAILVDLSSRRPELFNSENGNGELDARVEKRIAKIKDNQDGRSHLIRYQFETNHGRASEAIATLASVADEAQRRLIDHLENPTADRAPVAVGERPAKYWDFSLLAEVAFRLSESDKDQAREYYDFLTQIDASDWMPESLIETTYLLSGRLAFSQGDHQKALDIWKQGIEACKFDSFRLSGAIARVRVAQRRILVANSNSEQGVDEKTEKSVKRLRESINKASDRLNRTSEQQLTRNALGREIDTARWRLKIMESTLLKLSGQYSQAIENLDLALNSHAKIDDSERASAALQLAELHQRLGASDSAALAIEKAIELTPGDVQLRALAADAWGRAGNQERAARYWQTAGTRPSDPQERNSIESLQRRIASIEARFNSEMVVPPAEQDFSRIRATVLELQQDAAESLASTVENENVNDGLQRILAHLDIMDVLLPPVGVGLEKYWDSPEFAQAVVELAETRTGDARIQSFAAQRLAGVGDTERSDQAFQRLQGILGETSGVAVTRAKILASQGKFVEACKHLQAHAHSNSAAAESLLRLASSYASQAGDIELAYQAMLDIPESSLSPVSLFTIARIAGKLPDDSQVIRELQKTPKELAIEWRSKLRQSEGESGTYWRYLECSELIDQIRQDRNEIERDDVRLVRADQLGQELITIRPRWGQAISLLGWVFAIEGEHDQAIEQLRRGIAAGDGQLSTRRLLWEELYRDERYAEAESEIRQTEISTQRTVDANSTKQIQLAQMQGEFTRSLEMARIGVQQRPDDFVAHAILFQTALVAAEKTEDAEQRDAHLEEARIAIETAESLADSVPLAILSAKLALSVALKDEDSVRKQIGRIKDAEIDEFDRLLLMGKGYLAINDRQAALPLLEQALEQASTLRRRAKSLLGLANLFRKLKQAKLEEQALRLALKEMPDNAALRNRLAVVIATRGGKDVDWEELKGLLRGTELSTSLNDFQYAILLSVHGNDQQQEEAAGILRELVKEENSRSDDAARVLAVLLRKQIPARNELADDPPEYPDQVKRQVLEIESLYEGLIEKSSPEPVDLYRYADFLLVHGVQEDLDRVDYLSEELNSSEQGALAALEIGVRYRQKKGPQSALPDFIESWAETELKRGSLNKGEVSRVAGASLVRLGFIDEGLDRLDRGYRDEPKLLTAYVLILNQFERPERALKVCTEHHQQHDDVQSAILLAETMLNSPPEIITQQHHAIVEEAVRENMENSMLLESVATLKMQAEDYAKAVALYHLIDEKDPNRIRTLNNLAMAYSELTGREEGGIEPIERAIKIAGEFAELLDTYGVVLLRSGNLEAAEKQFRKAILKNPDEPRFQFHLILALRAQGKDPLAAALWKKLDVKSLELDPAGLTDRGRKQLLQIKKEFGLEEVIRVKGQPTQ